MSGTPQLARIDALVPHWRSVELPPALRKVVTMLAREERQFLYALGRDYWRGQGAIIDAGCFLGGSTLSLATGLIDNRATASRIGVVHSYDLFLADAHQVASYLKKFGTFSPGDSVRSVFDAQTLAVRGALTVHEGDLREFPWTASTPIEVLFIDVAKTWGLNDFTIQQFFPALIPGHSIVVQQDYVHPTCPWLAITMELLADYFEPIGYVPGNSMVYLHTAAIPESVIAQAATEFMEPERKLALMDQAIERCRSVLAPNELLELEAGRSLLLLWWRGEEAAADDISRIKTT
jgi:hypothetical protein